ncbi:eukaryotic initiation factor 4E [Gregarina niphandrodes]|uniref:Eukaryotic initiation factor 4E n=1 Tax=Gregarina niphandrodes TaxID=110365 RepID=A0A023B981_GRENI|nr:eukaryotic initiation factor 4E [Gregarina niphandrodes]EZG71572.1 eukaryotic initiation factor 4E [Gregarina niphandrodes]|eukprot:XP_011129817.1 eukaryotic initiation factor 4E [Gregarina niphandrodes]
MTQKSWLELSDDDEEADSGQVRQILEERLRRRKEEAEKITAGLQRSQTVGHTSARKVSNYGLQSTTSYGGFHNSSHQGGSHQGGSHQGGSHNGGSHSGGFHGGGFHGGGGGAPRKVANYGLEERPARNAAGVRSVASVDLTPPATPLYSEVDDDIVFSETFDIWYTDPTALSTRGTSKDLYETACCYVGNFNKLSEFYAFHNAIDWDHIPDGSVVAYCRKDVKPQWEDPRNEDGGRFLFKHWPRPEAERIFTKIALGFLSGMLLDWPNYNLVSLHVRSSARGSDIQLWRKCQHQGTGLTTGLVLSDIRNLFFAGEKDPTEKDTDSGRIKIGNATVTWMVNFSSVARNGNRLQHFEQRKKNLRSSTSFGGPSSGEPCSGASGSASTTSPASTAGPVSSGHAMSSGARKFKFGGLAELLSHDDTTPGSASSSCRDFGEASSPGGGSTSGSPVWTPGSPGNGLTRTRTYASPRSPYPDYDAPVQLQAYQRAIALKQQGQGQ